MDKTTTQQDLLLYYYNECGLLDADRIQRSLDGDPLIEAEYLEMQSALGHLDVPLLQPSDDVVRRVLARA